MNDVFSNLIEMARTGDTYKAAQSYSVLMNLPIQECLETMNNIRKTFQKVRIANKDEQLDNSDQQEINDGN